MAFQFRPLDIPDVVEVLPQVIRDDRGAFAEIYQKPVFSQHGIDISFVQFNYSLSVQGVLRGLHYQLPPKAQGKLVTVVAGEVFDVAVDVRQHSPTYGQWVSVTLSADKKNLIYIPAGFAHGFCVTSPEAHMLYYVTDVYSPKQERGIAWNDQALNIPWPTREPMMSDKDRAYPAWRDAEPFSVL